jgi:hypothetical protein
MKFFIKGYKLSIITKYYLKNMEKIGYTIPVWNQTDYQKSIVQQYKTVIDNIAKKYNNFEYKSYIDIAHILTNNDLRIGIKYISKNELNYIPGNSLFIYRCYNGAETVDIFLNNETEPNTLSQNSYLYVTEIGTFKATTCIDCCC